MQQRELGYFDTLLYFAHQQSISQMLVSLVLDTTVPLDTLQSACEFLIQRHPLLRAVVNEQDGALIFTVSKAVADIPFLTTTTITTEQRKQLADNMLHTQMDLSQHNVAFQLLKRQDLNDSSVEILMSISHVIADGLSFINLLQELLAFIDREMSLSSDPELPLHPHCESLLKKSTSLAEFFNNFSHSYDINPPVIKRFAEGYAHCPMPANTLTQPLSETLHSSLKQLAKVHGVTVYSLLIAAYVKAYWLLTKHPHDLAVGSAMSLRNKCEPKVPLSICGNYFSAHSSYFTKDMATHSIIDIAQSFRAQQGKIIQTQNFLPTNYDRREMTEKVKAMIAGATKTYEEQLGSSNLGNIDFQFKQGEIKDFSLHPKGSNQINFVCFSINGEQRLNLVYAKNYRSSDWVNKLMKAILHQLDELN